ncbi:MAG: carboxypeptidase M32 [Actinomycetota bacterium]|nr:carboxypeptidase M32 [Actinomycetota bacterium]
MAKAWERLEPKLRELQDIGSALALMSWDQAVMMPAGGAPGRARANATLEAIAHDRLTDPALGELLAELADDDSLDQEQQASVRILKRDHEKATKVPEDLVRAIAEAQGTAYQAWTEARPANDFSILEPHLARLLDLKRQQADALGWTDERYDALLDEFEPGMTAADVVKLFDDLRAGLMPIIDKVLDAAGDPPDWLFETYDTDRQVTFCNWLVEQLGFDMAQGRLDLSPHPFTMTVGAGDVRQTTRTEADALLSSVYAAVHETGHALYEQGIPSHLLDWPVGRAPSLGLHESQSRMWENQVGRSEAYTAFLLPHLKEHWPDELGMISPADFYRGVNHPRRTLIRVTADELTYNLHVAMRFELELAMFRDELSVSDLPDAWDDASEKTIGVRSETVADGVLQDMHWSMGALGYFPTYSLGTIYAAAFYDKAIEDLGDLSDDFRSGDTSRLLDWLRTNIHEEAYRYPAKELAERVTGGPLSAQPLLAYLDDKYSSLYGVTA